MYSTYIILGFGKTALATVEFLLKNHKESKVKVSEMKSQENFDLKLIEDFKAKGVEFEFGEQSEAFICAEEKSFIVLSPGIPPKAAIIEMVKNSGHDYGTDLDLFSFALEKDHRYAGITGTNGKTTTVSLLASIFNTPALGNIGKPFLDFKEVDASNFATEISSFQLFHSHHFMMNAIPDIAIHLNLTADHLDWHKDLEEYKEAKEKLFCRSTEKENFWVMNYDDPQVKTFALDALGSFIDEVKTKVLWFSNEDISFALSEKTPIVAYEKYQSLYLAKYLPDGQPSEDLNGMVSVNANDDYYLEIPITQVNDMNLVGAHNFSNVLAASLAAFALGFDSDYISDRVREFKAVPHRLEYVCEINGNRVFNDSKATNPDSSIKAIDSFDQPIVILGGKDKYLDLTGFLAEVSKKAYAVIAIGELKNKIYDILSEHGFQKIRRAETLEEAVQASIHYGDGNNFEILFSPASSSFDMFKSFEDRGDQFKAIVEQIAAPL